MVSQPPWSPAESGAVAVDLADDGRILMWMRQAPRTRPSPTLHYDAELGAGTALRRERELRLTMSQRLARLDRLCREMTSIAGRARGG
jgi:hypothetical protein